MSGNKYGLDDESYRIVKSMSKDKLDLTNLNGNGNLEEYQIHKQPMTTSRKKGDVLVNYHNDSQYH